MSDRLLQDAITATRPPATVGRRGLVAGVAALAAGGLAALTSTSARANDGDDWVLGQINTATLETRLDRNMASPQSSPGVGLRVTAHGTGIVAQDVGITNADPAGGEGVHGESTLGVGVHGSSDNVGVKGSSTKGTGVIGEGPVGVLGKTAAGSGIGVKGTSAQWIGVSGEGPIGVRGVGGKGDGKDAGTGVQGESDSGTGVSGVVTSGTGVYGRAPSGVGVKGESATKQGVLGMSQQSNGVEGTSISGTGVSGTSTSGTAVRGVTQDGVGVHGKAGANGKAGFFEGAVVINGSLTLNGQPVSYLVPTENSGLLQLSATPRQDGRGRWLESFGRSTLVDGTAAVRLDAEATGAAHNGAEYHVFLTPEGDSRGLYVTDLDVDGFVVREQGGGTASIPFSYRIVMRHDPRPSEVAELRA